jgi:hypothetical protein
VTGGSELEALVNVVKNMDGTRRAHLIGSIPAEDTAAAMQLAVKTFGADLSFLPDGETGERRNWILNVVSGFRAHPAFEVAKEGDWSGYDATPQLRVRRGQRLHGAELDLGIAAAVRAALPIYQEVRSTVPGLGYQVGIPGALDFATFTFGTVDALRYTRVFAQALSTAMVEVHGLLGHDALFQLEVPAELVLLTRAPRPARAAVARLLAGHLAKLALGAPPGARFGVHLCLGDLNHRALGRLNDAGPLVHFANALVERWPASRPLQYVHVPLAAAAEPPSEDPAFYRPLSRLRLGGVRLVAGYAHERQDLSVQRRIRSHIEEALGGPADVSTSCGLGRRDLNSAVDAMERTRTLLLD